MKFRKRSLTWKELEEIRAGTGVPGGRVPETCGRRQKMGHIGADLVVGVLGAIVLVHAAYATIIYRGELKVKEEEFVRPPLQVLVEVAISLALCFWAALRVPGTFLPISTDSRENRVVMLPANLDFMVFNHRGKLLTPALEMHFKTT